MYMDNLKDCGMYHQYIMHGLIQWCDGKAGKIRAYLGRWNESKYSLNICA